jgi:LuxR family transcriptional regulator, maltose regulon positive regulatory protein
VLLLKYNRAAVSSEAVAKAPVNMERVSIAKLSRPLTRGIFPRKRIFSLLDRASENAVIWISGPPGCGKTCSVASYFETRKLPCLWYQMDEADSDLASFFYYMGLAFKKVAPRKRKPLPLLTPEYNLGISVFALRYFENLYSFLTPPFFLVFDNYHRVSDESQFHEIMLNALSVIPQGIHVILISRSNPPVIFAYLRAHGRMAFLGWNELRFTLEESRNLVRLRVPKTLPGETLMQLYQITDGWAAGLALVSDAVRRGVEIRSFEKTVPEEIIGYFGNVIFSKTREETRTFLMKTAFLPRMTSKTAEDLTGSTNAETAFSSLTRNNYFIEEHHSNVPVYQYHPLFRNFLLSRAKELLDPDTISRLKNKAAALLEESGQIEDAAETLRNSGNWEALSGFIKRHAPSMLGQGRFQLVQVWLNAVPVDLIETDPWLLFWLGSCIFPSDPSQSLRCHEKAFDLFCNERKLDGTFLSLASIVDVIVFSHKNLSRLDQWILKLEDLMRDVKEFPSQEIGARVATGMVAALALRKPQHSEFDKWADRAFLVTETAHVVDIRFWLLFYFLLRNAMMGNFRRAASARYFLSDLTKSREATPFHKIMGNLADAIYYQMTGSNKECIKAVTEGMELSRRTGIYILDQPLIGHAVLSSLNVNDLATARRFLDRLASSLNSNAPSGDFLMPRNRHIYHLASLRYALACGNLTELPLHADLALKFAEEMEIPLFTAITCLMSAAAMHRLGNHKEATAQLQRGTRLALETKSRSLQFNSLLIRAYFAIHRGKEMTGLRLLRKALSLGKDERFLNTFLDDPFVTSRLCAEALKARIQMDYVREIIQRRNLIPDEASLSLEHWPWPLKIYSFGRFELYRDGAAIKHTRKAQEKPLLILKVLVAMRERHIRSEDIADILWPEADGDAAYGSFQVTLHRLRSLLGYPEAVQMLEGSLSLDAKFCWVDVWAFERLLDEADLESEEGTSEKAIQLTQRALELYRGSFLGEEGGQSWNLSETERLRSRFLRSVQKLGDHWSRRGKWEKAAECYLKGLDVDDLAEEFLRGLMKCYSRVGRKPEALALYRRFERRLKAILGIELSERTKTLRDAIAKGS